jgi:NADH-quinone oxidoreductase subunit J
VNPAPLASGGLLAGAIVATAASLWMLLPNGREAAATRRLGMLLGAGAILAFIAAGRRLGGLGEEAVFLIVSLVAVVSAAATIVSRSPVYAAIWFALSLTGVAGVLLVLGAQFLGVATIVVYAGAILVMFLFVLMLAQPAGLASYDRVSNEPFLSALAGAVLLGVLSLSIGRLSAGAPACCAAPARAAAAAGDVADAGAAAAEGAAVADGAAVANRAVAPPAAVAADPLAADQVARLGAELFGRHLVAVEAAGVLLLVALIGAIAIASRGESALASEAAQAAAMRSAAGRSSR